MIILSKSQTSALTKPPQTNKQTNPLTTFIGKEATFARHLGQHLSISQDNFVPAIKKQQQNIRKCQISLVHPFKTKKNV